MMTKMREHRCKACEFHMDVLEHNGERLALAPAGFEDEPFDGQCIRCGSSDVVEAVTVPLGVELGDVAGQGKHYPRFDRGLQCWVKNKAHRAQICKERRVVPVDGDVDLEKQALQDRYRMERDLKEWNELKEKYDTDPDFADYRRARDRGVFRDQIKRQQPWRRKAPTGA